MRIRVKEGKKGGILTYKPSGNKISKVMKTKEYEVYVDKPEELMEIFAYLGIKKLDPAPVIEKESRNYEYGDINVCIDKYPIVGTFVDIEILAKNEKQATSAEAKVNAFAKQLGFSEADRQKSAVGFLLKEYYERGGK